MQDNDKDKYQKWRRFEFLYEGTQDMILSFSKNGTVHQCNRRVYEELGYEEGDEINMQDLFPSCMNMSDMGLIEPDVAVTDAYETNIYRKNQTCFPVQMRVAFLVSDNEEDYGICRACNAIVETEAKRRISHAKEEIEKANKERNEMVSNVTHELRTPVNGVLGLAQNLLDSEVTKEQKDTLELIIHCCNNMTKIINNILDYSKQQAGKFTLEDREFSFHTMMDKVVKMNTPAIEEKGLRLTCNVSKSVPDRMIGDELRITQILNNLLSNAIKFTSIGQVVVNVALSYDYEEEMELFFMVIDSGIGISLEERDKLFKSFSQVDASITRKYGGTGLGLSIVKQLVEMMGGTVNVESEKGKGSTFSFSIRTKKVEQKEGEQEKIDVAHSFNHLDMADQQQLEVSELYRLGSQENMEEIKANMERLVLCIEMENYEKANGFAENVKQLVVDDPTDLKRKAFRLQMTLRKGDHDTAIEEYETLKETLIAKEVLEA